MDVEVMFRSPGHGLGSALAEAGPAPLVLEVRVCGRVFVRALTGHALVGRRDGPRNVYPDLDLGWDDAVSRRHAELSYRDGQYWICDLRSTNGTILNRLELTPGRQFPLSPGDELSLGESTHLRVLEAPVPEYTSDPPAGNQASSAPLPFLPVDKPHVPLNPDPDERHVLELIDELMAD